MLAAVSQAEVTLNDFSSFNLTGTYVAWDAGTFTSGATAFTVQANDFGGGFHNLPAPVNGSGNDTLSVRLNVNPGNVADKFNVILVDGDGTERVYRIDGVGIGDDQTFTKSLSAFLQDNAPGSTPGLDLTNLTAFHLQGSFANGNPGQAMNLTFDKLSLVTGPPPPPEPADVVLRENFNAASTKWGTPGVPPGGTSAVTWSDTEGNPPGSTRIEVANPGGAPAGIRFAYTATGLDFGTTGPVKISFDAKGTALVGTALHVRFNGNFIGAIQGSFNGDTYTTFTRTFDLNQGFAGTDTFVLDFEFAMGAVPGSGGSYLIDNIQVLSNLPDGQPLAASIQLGTLVGWTPVAAESIYQPQESADGIDYTNLGPAIAGTSVSSVFDPTPAFSYRVEEAVPVIQNVAYNGGFEEEFLGDLEGWAFFGNQPPALIDTDARTGTNSVRILAAATVADPMGPTYAAGVSGFEQNTTNATTDSNPGGPLVTPGKTYDFSFWAKQISSGPGYVQNYRVAWLDSVGAIVGSGGFQGFTGALGVWEKKSQNGLVAPAGAASAQILIQGLTGAFDGSTGEVIIDDISLETTGSGDANILAATAVPAAEISWPSKSGLTYGVNSSLNLDGFAPFAGPFDGNNSILKVYDAPLVGRKFYQVTED
jgi:hypothetical protein